MKKEYLSRKDSLILTAIELIDSAGIQGLTIRELANCQEITDGAIYRHFKTKNDIIMAVLDHFSSFDSTIIGVIKEQNMNAKEGLLFLIKSYAEYYENYPALASVEFIYDFIKNEQELAQRMMDIFDYRFKSTLEIITEGKNKGDIICDMKPDELADIILGIKKQIVFRWRLHGYSFGLKGKMMAAVEGILHLC